MYGETEMTNGAFAFGLGVGTHNSKGDWLETFFPQPILHPAQDLTTALGHCDSNQTLSRAQLEELRAVLAAAGESGQAGLAAQFLESSRPAVAVLLQDDRSPGNVPEAYLKLHLLYGSLSRCCCFHVPYLNTFASKFHFKLVCV